MEYLNFFVEAVTEIFTPHNLPAPKKKGTGSTVAKTDTVAALQIKNTFEFNFEKLNIDCFKIIILKSGISSLIAVSCVNKALSKIMKDFLFDYNKFFEFDKFCIYSPQAICKLVERCDYQPQAINWVEKGKFYDENHNLGRFTNNKSQELAFDSYSKAAIENESIEAINWLANRINGGYGAAGCVEGEIEICLVIAKVYSNLKINADLVHRCYNDAWSKFESLLKHNPNPLVRKYFDKRIGERTLEDARHLIDCQFRTCYELLSDSTDISLKHQSKKWLLKLYNGPRLPKKYEDVRGQVMFKILQNMDFESALELGRTEDKELDSLREAIKQTLLGMMDRNKAAGLVFYTCSMDWNRLYIRLLNREEMKFQSNQLTPYIHTQDATLREPNSIVVTEENWNQFKGSLLQRQQPRTVYEWLSGSQSA